MGEWGPAVVLRFSWFKNRPVPVEFDSWVFFESGAVPDRTETLVKMAEYRPALTQWESRFSTDIRLDIGLAARAVNPHVFRPDLLRDDVPVTAEILTGLGRAQQMLRVRFISKEPVEGQDHLHYLNRLTLAYASLLGASVIFDAGAERLWDPAEFEHKCAEVGNLRRWEVNARTIWSDEGPGASVRTCGLVKLGAQEWKTDIVHRDMQILVTETMDIALEKAFEAPEILAQSELEIEAHGVPVKLRFESRRGSTSRHVRIYRS